MTGQPCMTFHIITILKHGARLSVDRGFLVCDYPDQTENRVALADVRILVIGVPAVAFTNACLARLLAQDSLILHCDHHYKPIGWTTSLERVIRKEVFANQISQNETFTKLLWKKIVHQKMANQASVLDTLGIEHGLLRLINKPLANEANVSRQFWGLFFEYLGQKQTREKKNAESFENKALNYGYAVLSTLIHRAILIYGLLPPLGIHHEYRYRSYPLVYDLVEPFRSFVDLFLARWISQNSQRTDDDFENWVRYFMSALRDCRIKIPANKHSYKLLDSIDAHVRSVATCFENQYFESENLEKLWLPELKYHYWHDPKNIESDLDEEEDEAAFSS